jgi:uncharacterized repeat protein (TIGR03803 family)
VSRTKPWKFLSPVLFAFFFACISAPAPAQTYTVLHTFAGSPKDGQWPLGVLVRDAAGNLYGTTEDGGSGTCGQFSCGTVFMLNKFGNEVGVFSFDEPDGTFPFAGLFRDAAGNLYGTTFGGGVHSCENDPPGCGTVFQLNKTGNKLRYFSFDGNNGFDPLSTPVILSGSLYGTTYEGGNQNFGTLYKINALGKETVLHKFNGADGCGPTALIADPKGNLYGVTDIGACNSSGTLFEFDTAGNFTMLARFGGVFGANPQSLIFDSQGNLYGTALDGGSNGDGTVFELWSQNGMWSGHALYSFCSLPLCVDGKSPRGQLVRDNVGNIFGVTYDGGAYDNGTIFKIDPSGNETVLYSFTGGSDGGGPFGGLIMDASGNLYGAAETGGDISCPGAEGIGCGTVFEFTP